MSTHKAIEDSYCLRDAEHTAGTNKYTFRYNFQWRNIIQEHLTVSVRSVKLWLAPRHLWINGLQVHSGSNTEPTMFNTTITGSMSEFNDKLANMSSTVGYTVYYNPTNRRLVFDCATDNYFDYTSAESIEANMSEDMEVITGQTNFHNVEVLHTNANNYIDAWYLDEDKSEELNLKEMKAFIDKWSPQV